ncbi:MAG TPA: hypothetical protein VNZ53_56685 [Steroidobacteraceae bacterium]|jgi:hypothetical protein|nr:hypothetical protein [Steroidobacteraceae bacterium]
MGVVNGRKIVLKPRLLPRGLVDAAVVAISAIIQICALFLLPPLLIYVVFRSAPAALILALLTYLAFLAFSVWSIVLTSEGIRFRRLFGYPKYLPWTAITSVESTPRLELIVKGWLWPLLPAREMTPSMTSQGHYRISWKGGFCYFPPRDTVEFENYVSEHISRDFHA